MKNYALAAAAALGLSAGTLQAAPYTLDFTNSANIFGSQALYSTVTIDSAVYDGTFYAGQFDLIKDGFEQILAFCVEVTQAIVDGDGAYESTPDLFTAPVIENIDRLFSSAYDLVTDGVSAAGFQVALWEIVEDTTSGLDLTAGTFSAVDASTANGSVVTTAQGFLDGLATASTGLFDLDFMASPGSQDLVTASRAVTTAPVPVPASGLLLLSAGGLMVLRRKKR